MQFLSRLLGPGFILLCLLAVVLKALIPLPGAVGYAPLDLGFGARAQPVEVVIWYSTEKEAWLEEAARRFEASGATSGGRPITLSLVGLGSRELVERVAREDWRGDPRPSVISPASSVWTEELKRAWAARNGGTILAGETPPLVLTPLVAVSWEERGELIWPDGGARFWHDLHDAVTAESWPAFLAGRGFAADSAEAQRAASWGFVKFGHTSPLSSNSGAQTLILLAYAYHGKTSGLTAADVADPQFQAWLKAIEGATLDFGASTGDLMTSMVQRGPSSFDAVMVYENLALSSVQAAQNRNGQPARIFYPPATMVSDHPYAILGAPLTKADQQAAAERFRDFLLARPQQELALTYGFRPALAEVAITGGGAENPFTSRAANGARVDLGAQVETPAPEVTAALITLWEQAIAPTLKPRR